MSQIRTDLIKCNVGITIDVLALPYFGPINGKDLHGEYFSKSTNFFDDIKYEIPVFWVHGSENGFPPEKIGSVVNQWYTEEGKWMQVSLNQDSSRFKQIIDAHKSGTLRGSTGVIPATKVVNKETGHIDSWQTGELSFVDLRDGYIPINGFAITKAVLFEDYYGDPVQEGVESNMSKIKEFLVDLREKLSSLLNMEDNEEIMTESEVMLEAETLKSELEGLVPDESYQKCSDALNWVRTMVKAGKLPPSEALPLVEKFKTSTDGWDEIRLPIEERSIIHNNITKARQDNSVFIAGGQTKDIKKEIDNDYMNRYRSYRDQEIK